jgi:glycogen operon protein
MLLPGTFAKLGASVHAGGVNFALAAAHAEAVTLCLFDEEGLNEIQRFRVSHCTNGIWHCTLPHARPGTIYGWRVHGPWAPEIGQRFNPCKLLLDPYAREVVGEYTGDDVHLGHDPIDAALPDKRDNARLALKARVVEDLPNASRGPVVPPHQRVIYEMHVKGFTKLHSAVPPELRGTFAGVAHPAAVAHLKSLGVTSICLMPVAHRADEVRLQKLGLSNYWGYSPIAWSAPEARYCSGTDGSSPRTEFRAMVDALHAAGLEVILDVVYNHTAETDELGPTLSLRGIDNQTYYHLDPLLPQNYLNWTGCGNSVNLNSPFALRLVMDSLRCWVEEFGIDGFRFDLATVLARGEADRNYQYSGRATFLAAVAQDPVLRNRLMIAEPWDIGLGGYNLGGFPPGWLEWNDKFRDAQRAYWSEHGLTLGTLAQRMAGSTDHFVPRVRAPHSSVNFVTAHDGFNLTDLVSYEYKHNEANGEDNRDGHGHNLSSNHGTEGASTDEAVKALRLLHKRALLACNLFSLGTPMLLSGDEIGHSQQGNNNAYCQDNEIAWLDWAHADRELLQFVTHLLHVRRQRPALQSRGWWQTEECAAGPLVKWFKPDGLPVDPETWQNHQMRAIGLQISPAQDSLEDDCLLLLNASAQAVTFSMPPGEWWLHLNTTTGDCTDTLLGGPLTVAAGALCLASTSPLSLAC